MKITFGICTYDRPDILEISSKSLYEIDGIENVNIRIYDDRSTIITPNNLERMYSTAKSIHINETNLGADANTRYMYEDFFESDDEYFFNADSDLIYNRDVLDVIYRYIHKYGQQKYFILSLYNSTMHPEVKNSEDFLYKEHIGAAGTLMNRNAVEYIINRVWSENLDYAWCKSFRSIGVPILCTKKSYVQHIGIVGENTDKSNVDWGKNFKIDTLTNANAIEYVIEHIDVTANISEKLEYLASGGKVKVKVWSRMGWEICRFHINRLFGSRRVTENEL